PEGARVRGLETRGPAKHNKHNPERATKFVGWGRRIQPPATWPRPTRPTTRRSPPNPPNLTTPADGRPSRIGERRERAAPTTQRIADLRVRLGRKRGTLAVGI